MTEQQITAYDLGEDGEQWMVEGTLDHEEARLAVLALWAEQGVEAEYPEQVAGNADFGYTAKSTWWWETVNAEGVEQDPWLRGFITNESAPDGTETFSGVLMQV